VGKKHRKTNKKEEKEKERYYYVHEPILPLIQVIAGMPKNWAKREKLKGGRRLCHSAASQTFDERGGGSWGRVFLIKEHLLCFRKAPKKRGKKKTLSREGGVKR